VHNFAHAFIQRDSFKKGSFIFKKGNRPSFEELQTYISEFQKPIKTRQLREDLRFLREEGIDGNPIQIKMKGFRYQIENGRHFDYSSLLDSERYTLPLVFAALQPFERFPAVQAILHNLIAIHKLNSKELVQLSAAIGTHMSPLNERFVDCIITIMQAIHEEKAVEFNYYKVDQGAISASNNDLVYRCVFPLQLRVFEGRYYLVGLRTEQEAKEENVEHFPIDRIHRRVDIALNNEDQAIKFDWASVTESVHFNDLFKHRVGMYRSYGEASTPEWVYRWFRGWAASMVLAVPIHNSQEIVQKSGGDIRIRLHVVKTPDLENTFRKFGEFCWE
jgi:predicted DNA-binding transcriptional regulator YafY